MRPEFKFAYLAARWVAGAIALLAVLLLLLLDTFPGRAVVAWSIAPLTGGSVAARGLSGDLPDHLVVEELDIRDDAGAWLEFRGVTLDWSPWPLFHNRVVIKRAFAQEIVFARRQIPEENAKGKTPEIDIGYIEAPRIVIAKAVLGQEAILAGRGSLDYVTRHQVSADLTLLRPATGDTYRVQGVLNRQLATGTLSIHEGANGILAGLLGFPGLRPVNLEAQAQGDRGANTIAFRLSAGALQATGRGTIALDVQHVDFDVTALAPSVTLRPGLGFSDFSLDGHIHGPFDAPRVAAHFNVDGVRASGIEIARLSADLKGDYGALDLNGSAISVRAGAVDEFAKAPFVFAAHTNLSNETLPTSFSLKHPLASLTGSAKKNAQQKTVSAHLSIPSLQALASLLQTNVSGSAAADATTIITDTATTISLNGTISATGTDFLARLFGPRVSVVAQGRFEDSGITQSHVSVHGAAVSVDASGTLRGKALNYQVSLGLGDLARLSPELSGTLNLRGSVTGNDDAPVIRASGDADMASKGFARQRIALSLETKGFSEARMLAKGRFDDAPLTFDATFDSRRRAALTAQWRSLSARASLALPQNAAPAGRAQINVKNLADLALLTGTPISGNANATVDFGGGSNSLVLRVSANNLRQEDVNIARVAVSGSVDDPFGTPNLAIAADAAGLSLEGATGDAQIKLRGRLASLAVSLTTSHLNADGRAADISADANVDLIGKRLVLSRFGGVLADQPFALARPAAIDFASGVAVDTFQIRVASGELILAGRVTPALSASLDVRGIAGSLLADFVPQLPRDSSFTGNAKLSGTLAEPQGAFALEGHNLTERGLSAGARGSLSTHGTLRGTFAELSGSLETGHTTHLTFSGRVPLKSGQTLALDLAGSADLAILNNILAVRGRRAQGTLTMQAHLAGTFAAPRVNGTAALENATFEDIARGIRLSAISLKAEAQGDQVRITGLSARGGRGTLSGGGTITFANRNVLLALSAEMDNLRLITSDLITAEVSGKVTLTGPAAGAAVFGGRLAVSNGELNLPDSFPPEVVSLGVRHRGQPSTPPPAPFAIGLDVVIDAPSHLFVHGRGIDADISGKMHLGGSSAEPIATGEFEMNRGTLSLAGQTLTFTSGKVYFNSSGLSGRIDPWLDFEAQSVSGGITATLTVSGYASQPKIVLSSVPTLPQDEILARLLFQQSASQLSAIQLAQMGQALAEMGGIGTGFNPLGVLRKRLGLDRLSVGSTQGPTPSQTQTTVEAGRYVARNVYVGVKQTISGATQAQVQYDITRNFKAQATVSTMTGSTTQQYSNAVQDNGSSIGLSYQVEY